MLKWFLVLSLFLPVFAYAKESVIIYNRTQNKVVLSQNTEAVRPIASVTKLMTAMVVLDNAQNLDDKVKLQHKVKSSLPTKEYTRAELLDAMLVRSDNGAAETLATSYPGGREAFINAMNNKAKSIGMYNTSFDDASGLSRNNISTAEDVNRMIIEAFGYNVIRDVSTKKQVSVSSTKNKTISLSNTNTPILTLFDNIELSKTGYTTPAGFCLVMVVNKGAELFSVVILGSDNKQARFNLAKNLLTNHLND